MRFSSCLLPVTFFSAGVSAFYPYGFSRGKESESAADSGTDGDKRRFYPWLAGGSNGVEEGNVVTLDIKRGPKVRDIGCGFGYRTADCGVFRSVARITTVR